MTVYENIKSKNIDEFAEWLDKYGFYEDSPWMDWWNKNYCGKCESEIVFAPYLNHNIECCWCELNNRCKFFPEMDKQPSSKEMIKMWLESEAEYE